MCVILVCPADVRPDRRTLAACHEANPHGAGVAWREDGVVRWFKGLEPRELEPLIAGLSGEIVIHFRWASVGEVTPKLCHPFPITACATTRLSGHARAALFHNGTWCQWRETLRRMKYNMRGTPTGSPLSSRSPTWRSISRRVLLPLVESGWGITPSAMTSSSAG